MRTCGVRLIDAAARQLMWATALVLLTAGAMVSAHRVLGTNHPTSATALIQSPTASPSELPVPIFNSGLSVICIRATNTSPVDTRITAIGLELPGSASGFALLTPLASGLSLQENVTVPGFPGVVLDVVVTTGTSFTGPNARFGLPPSTTPTNLCISGPFNPATPIEIILNGVFVRFDGSGALGNVSDIGVWERRPRS